MQPRLVLLGKQKYAEERCQLFLLFLTITLLAKAILPTEMTFQC